MSTRAAYHINLLKLSFGLPLNLADALLVGLEPTTIPVLIVGLELDLLRLSEWFSTNSQSLSISYCRAFTIKFFLIFYNLVGLAFIFFNKSATSLIFIFSSS